MHLRSAIFTAERNLFLLPLRRTIMKQSSLFLYLENKMKNTTIRTKAPKTDLLMIGLTAGLNSPNNLCNPSECGVSGIFHFSDNQLLKKNLITPKKGGSVFVEKYL